MVKPIKQCSIEEVSDIVRNAGIPAFRASQILEWIYGKRVSSYEEMTNLPKAMRAQLAEFHPLHSPSIVEKQESSDGTCKFLIAFNDDTSAEMVALPAEDGRLTACISSQAGCAMQCSFCATGKQGLVRSLFPGEIVDQVVTIEHELGRRITNVVVMGQGEPFANYDNVMAALRILNHPKYGGIGARHITVSTSGLLKAIEQFSREPEQFTLAISLHSAKQDMRDKLMPALSNQRLDTLKRTLFKYTECSNRRFTFEYALMKGVNDSDSDLKALIDYCKGLLCHVNLIPLNEVAGSDFHPVERRVMMHWCDALNDAGVAASIRKSRGADIDAACGQLAGKVRS